MSFLPQALKNFLKYEDNTPNLSKDSLLDSKVPKKTVVAIGTMRAGKTTHFAGLGAVAQYKASESAKAERRFRAIINEGAGNILDDIAELRCGHFPEATKPVTSTTIRPGLTFEWEDPTFFGSKFLTSKRQAVMPIIDFAGEQLVGLMRRVKAARTLEQAAAVGDADQLTVTVNQASALLLIVNACRAEGLPIFLPEPYERIPGMSKHPDVNMQRIVSPILEYKHANKGYSPPLERVGIVLTACDMLFPISKLISNFTGRPFDPLNPEISNQSLDTFMKAFFPGTHSLIASLGVNIQYFPSYFELERDTRGEIVYWDAENKADPKIKRGNIFDSPDWEHNVNRPKFTEFWFNREIEWLKEFATMV
jgi:hypothetical protein